MILLQDCLTVSCFLKYFESYIFDVGVLLYVRFIVVDKPAKR